MNINRALPVIYVGPGALRALAGEKGILHGRQRPGWVDLLCFEPLSTGDWRKLVDRRFEAAADWDAVGVVLSRRELERREKALAGKLVAGDVVLTPPEVPEARGKTEAYVNVGDRLAPARLKITRARSATSTRSRRRHR
jgi:hypothetical protein